MTKRALFRFDAGPGVGGGHAARCLSLASALENLKWRVAFAVNDAAVQAVTALRDSDRVRTGVDTVPNAMSLLDGSVDAVVLDHYGMDGRFFDSVAKDSPDALRIAFDDLADRPLDADVVIDPLPDRTGAEYRPYVPEGASLLLGPDYACLRPEFAARRLSLPPIAANAQGEDDRAKLLVNFGALDGAGATQRVLSWLNACSAPIAVTVYLTGASSQLDTIRSLIPTLSFPVDLVVDPPSVPDLMIDADIAIAAGGSGSWERAALGLPALVFHVADNQIRTARSGDHTGASRYLGAIDDPLAESRLRTDLDRLLTNRALLTEMQRDALAACDGFGARRVAATLDIAADRATDRGRPVLRKMRKADEPLLLAWQNAEGTRRYFRDPSPVSAADHAAWMQRRLSDPRCIDQFLTIDGDPVAFVRLDQVPMASGRDRHWEVSIVVAPGKTGGGIGKTALDMINRMFPDWTLVAEVAPENAASLRVFTASGFKAMQGNWLRRDAVGPCPASGENE